MDIGQAVVLFLAAMLGGALNSVAGGGSFIAFPALLVYQPTHPIEANATNTVALWPGTLASVGAYRKELDTQRHVLLSMGSASLLGGIMGAWVLLHTEPPTFERLLPYLLLFATLLFTFGGSLAARVRRRMGQVQTPSWLGVGGVAFLQFFIAFYGGFFGGGIGILMLATLSLLGMTEIHVMNALKTVLAALINGVAVAMFVYYGKVFWPQAAVMIVGAIVGGYGGAYYAQKVSGKIVREFVIAVGFTMTAYFFYVYGPWRA